MNKKGFTLLELIIVIIVLGVLATLGFSQYSRVVERGRTAEAKAILGQIRTAEQGYYLEQGEYSTNILVLAIEAPRSCSSTHYFQYQILSDGRARAIRCTSGGKIPEATSSYNIDIDFASGVFSGDQGYY